MKKAQNSIKNFDNSQQFQYGKEKLQLSRFWNNTRILFKSDDQLLDLLQVIEAKFHSLDKDHGTKHALTYFKEIERHHKMMFMDQPSEFDQSVGWTKLNKKGALRFLRLNRRRCRETEYKQGVLTILGFYKLLHVKPDRNVSSIEGPPLNKWSLSFVRHFTIFSKDFLLNKLKLSLFTLTDDFCIYGSAKAGASGPLAMGETSIRDYQLLKNTGLIQAILDLCKCLYNDPSELVEAMYFTSLEYKRKSKFKHPSRVHFLPEGGGKTRVIAIPDIFTQSVLWPIHNYLMKVLRILWQDGTYSHEELTDKLKLMMKKRKVFCYDISAATDRFPIILQIKILEILFGKTISRLWIKIVHQRKFNFFNEEGDQNECKYRVGQPMGYLSSWPLFTLTHHMLVHFAAWKSGGKPIYLMIGDDVAIGDETTSLEYLNMMQYLGVEIAKSKTILSRDGQHRGEIAKRLVYDNIEISPLPPKVVANATLDCNGYLEFLEVLSSRTGNFRNRFSVLNLVQSISDIVHNNREKEKIFTLYNCPIKLMVPFLKPLTDTMMLLYPEVTMSSRTSLSSGQAAFLYDGFLREQAAYKVTEYQKKLSLSDRGNNPLSTPILENYLYEKHKVISDKISAVNFLGDSESSVFVDALTSLNDLLSEPDVFDSSNFLKKRDIRRSNTVESIIRFMNKFKNPFQGSPLEMIAASRGERSPDPHLRTGERNVGVNPQPVETPVVGETDLQLSPIELLNKKIAERLAAKAANNSTSETS